MSAVRWYRIYHSDEAVPKDVRTDSTLTYDRIMLELDLLPTVLQSHFEHQPFAITTRERAPYAPEIVVMIQMDGPGEIIETKIAECITSMNERVCGLGLVAKPLTI
jgi:hypothetical protein